MKKTIKLKATSIEHVYIKGDEIIITGYSDPDDDKHNCDDAGCARECVLFRGTLMNKEFYVSTEIDE